MNMLLDVSHVLSGDVACEENTLSIQDLDLPYFEQSGVEIVPPVDAFCRVTNSAGVVTLSVSAPVSYKTVCARCLKELEIVLPLELSELLVSKLNEDDNWELLEVPDGKADITQLIFEALCFELPLRHLCGDDCKGICPKCGKDLNYGNCTCTKREPDARLAVLSKLIEEAQDGEN